MSLTDGILITVLNTVACVLLPKILSVFAATKPQDTQEVQLTPTSHSV